jgi:hypothetical protein
MPGIRDGGPALRQKMADWSWPSATTSEMALKETYRKRRTGYAFARTKPPGSALNESLVPAADGKLRPSAVMPSPPRPIDTPAALDRRELLAAESLHELLRVR